MATGFNARVWCSNAHLGHYLMMTHQIRLDAVEMETAIALFTESLERFLEVGQGLISSPKAFGEFACVYTSSTVTGDITVFLKPSNGFREILAALRTLNGHLGVIK